MVPATQNQPLRPPMATPVNNNGSTYTKPTAAQRPAPPRKPWEPAKKDAEKEPDTWYYRQAKVSGARLRFTTITGRVLEGIVIRDGRYSVLVGLDSGNQVLLHKHALEAVEATK
jgi:hypothetical protein